MFWCGAVKICRKKLFNGQIAGFFVIQKIDYYFLYIKFENSVEK